MGANVSAQITSVVTKTMNEVNNSINTSVSNEQITRNVASNNITITGGTITGGGDVTFEQTGKITASNILSTNTNFKSSLQTKLKTAVANKIQTIADQANKDLNLFQLNASIQTAITSNEISNQIDNSVTQSIKSLNDATTTVGNTITLDLTKISAGKNVAFKQDSVIDAISKSISKNITNNVANSVMTTDVSNEVALKATQKNTGLNLDFLIAIAAIVTVGGGVAVGGKVLMDKNKKKKAGEDSLLKNASPLIEDSMAKIGGNIGSMFKNNWKYIFGVLVVLTIIILLVYFLIIAPKKKKYKDYVDFAKAHGAVAPYK